MPLLKRITSYLKKLKRYAKQEGLNTGFIILIIITLASIITISLIISMRTTTFSRAEGESCPKGIGTYMEKPGCEQICGVGKCKDCMLNTTQKWYCNANLAASGGYNLPTCSGKSFNLQSACIAELGSCTKCSVDGTAVRWHAGKEAAPTTKPTQGCVYAGTKQKICSNNMVSNPNSDYWKGKDNNYYGSEKTCSTKRGGINEAALCGLSAGHTPSPKMPETSISPSSQSITPDPQKCYVHSTPYSIGDKSCILNVEQICEQKPSGKAGWKTIGNCEAATISPVITLTNNNNCIADGNIEVPNGGIVCVGPRVHKCLVDTKTGVGRLKWLPIGICINGKAFFKPIIALYRTQIVERITNPVTTTDGDIIPCNEDDIICTVSE